MHTSITALQFGTADRDDVASDVLALLYFYGVIALALSFLIAAEVHLGTFAGLSGVDRLTAITLMFLTGPKIGADFSSYLEECDAENDSRPDSHCFGNDCSDGVNVRPRAGRGRL